MSRVVNIKLFFINWFYYDLIIQIQVMQNPISKFRESSIVFVKPDFLSKNSYTLAKKVQSQKVIFLLQDGNNNFNFIPSKPRSLVSQATLFQWNFDLASCRKRAQAPTKRNWTVQLPSFSVIVRVIPGKVHFKRITLKEALLKSVFLPVFK